MVSPADWRMQRLLVSARTVEAPPFLDVEDTATHEFLTTVLAPQLVQLGVDVLDVAALRGADRALTRAIASWAYTAQDENGQYRFAGLRYMSRLGPYECWAVFEGADIEETSRSPILPTDPDLVAIVDLFGLRIF